MRLFFLKWVRVPVPRGVREGARPCPNNKPHFSHTAQRAAATSSLKHTSVLRELLGRVLLVADIAAREAASTEVACRQPLFAAQRARAPRQLHATSPPLEL